MRLRTVPHALAALLLTAGIGQAQNAKIQAQIEKKLDEKRKEQKKDDASLEALLALALKNNADIRVAEAKLREADAELYRARMNVLKRITMLQQQIKSSKVAVEAATAQYEGVQKLAANGAISQTEVTISLATLMKAKAELSVAEAEMDGVTGKRNAMTGKWSLVTGAMADLDWRDGIVEVLVAPGTNSNKFKGTGARGLDTSGRWSSVRVEGPLSDKIRTALDRTITVDFKGEVTGRDVLELLRSYTKGVNITGASVREDVRKLELAEPIKLAAFFEWVEDQFDWRFIVRDYGIVASERSAVPPGAVLLLELWRKGAAPAQPTAPK